MEELCATLIAAATTKNCKIYQCYYGTYKTVCLFRTLQYDGMMDVIKVYLEGQAIYIIYIFLPLFKLLL